MDEGYGWDATGNLSTQVKEDRYVETFTYDNLSRLTHAYVTVRNGTPLPTPLLTHWAQYDALGNICARIVDGAGQGLTYAGRAGCGVATANGSGGTGVIGPHQVSKVGVGGNARNYYYDLRGNQTLRDSPGTPEDRAIQYSLDDKAYEIALGGTVRTRFWYGSDGQRYKRMHDGKKTLYLGNVEIETVGSVTTIKRNVGGVLQQSIVGSTVTGHYLFHDHLGSLVKTTNASGTAIDGLDYQPFGQRRHVADPAVTVEVGSSLTLRGFTGHEHVDAVGMEVIHMNGRIYDPEIGRFLQADPVIQAPGNLQSWNAYTYVFNNPLAYTDPSGMISIGRILRIAVAVVITVYTGGAAAGYWSFFGTSIAAGSAAAYGVVAAGGFAAGAITTGTLKGGLIGALSAVSFYGVGQWASGANVHDIARLGAHAMTGGVIETLQGGNFGHGFVSAGLSKSVMGSIDTGNIFADGMIVALVGGAISEMTGGKFANGAVTAAMQFAFNQIGQRVSNPIRTVTVRAGLELTEQDQANINGINQALRDYGVAVYASGDAEAIRNYKTASLLYDPEEVSRIDARSTNGETISAARAGGNRILFGRGRSDVNIWSRAAYGDFNGSVSYGNASFFTMSGRSMRAWMVAHEFGHLHSSYRPVFGNPTLTENRANSFARSMTPHINRAAGLSVRIMYGPY